MIDDPDTWAVKYAELGVFSVTVHLEACKDATSIAKLLRSNGSRAGLAIKPNTPVSEVLPYLDEFDQLLIMSVEPGFGGQSFIESSMGKIEEAAGLIAGKDLWLQVDGGVDESNIGKLAAAGVNTFVAGSAVFKANDRNLQIAKLRQIAEQSENHGH
jgi:ribulose-phosphate 3-epimerase